MHVFVPRLARMFGSLGAYVCPRGSASAYVYIHVCVTNCIDTEHPLVLVSEQGFPKCHHG